MNIENKLKLITHNNRFHADDVFAAATLSILLEKRGQDFEIIRTRDKEIIKTGDFVFDNGGIYDPETNRFDHHQKETAGQRENGITYSSFGLVWKKYSEEICNSSDISPEQAKKIAKDLDKIIVQPIDAVDNGIDLYENKPENPFPYTINGVVSSFIPSWPEEQDFDGQFLKAVEMAKWILQREIIKRQDVESAVDKVDEIYNQTEDKRVIVLEENYPWESIVPEYPEPLFVVKVRSDDMWSAKTVGDDMMHSFERRTYFPESWAGKAGEDLAQVTGVEDAVFCHNARFICAAKTKEGAIKLAKLALQK